MVNVCMCIVSVFDGRGATFGVVVHKDSDEGRYLPLRTCLPLRQIDI
jgi:hypothetical protein